MARPSITYNATPGIATGADGTTATGASFTPTAGKAYLVIARVHRGSGTADDFTVAHSGSLGSLTALDLNNVFSQGAVANGARIKAFGGQIGGSPTAGTLTITCTNTHTAWLLQYFEITDQHLTTLLKQATVTNEVTDSTATLTATLGAACTANSLIVGIFNSDNAGAATITDPAAGGWAARIADTNHASSSGRQVVWYNTSEVQSFESNPSAAADFCVAIMEFQEAAAVGGGGTDSSASVVPVRVRLISVVPQ